MAALCNLPTELVIEIMKNSANSSCLWSLINVSSRFKSIFMAFAREIVEEVVTRTTPDCTQTLMRMAVATRTSPDVGDVARYRQRGKFFGPMPRDMSPQLLYGFVESAHTIHSIAHACLDFYIERSLNAKPQRMDDSDLQDDKRIKSILNSQSRSPGQPFQPKAFGAPTYLEEQIVIRALWRLQLFLDMKTAYRTGTLTHWSEEDRNHLKTVADIPEMARFFHDPGCKLNPTCQMEQILSVIDFVKETIEDPDGPIEEVLTRFLHRPHLAVRNKAYRLHCFPKPIPTLEDISGRERLVDIDNKIEHRTIGCRFYYLMIRNKNPPLKNISFAPWRKLGFALWQTERIVELGFLGSLGSKNLADVLMNPEEAWFTWRSILTPEEDIERRVIRPCHFM